MIFELISEFRFFGGRQIAFRHSSVETGAVMQCSIFLPPETARKAPPVLWWLSGMTCTDQSFAQKGGAQRIASALGIALIMPDTSPRGVGLDGAPVPDGPEGAFDLGQGAGHYVDATEAPWATNYRMFSYVTRELPGIIADHFDVDLGRQAISGGLHGRSWGADGGIAKSRPLHVHFGLGAAGCALPLAPGPKGVLELSRRG